MISQIVYATGRHQVSDVWIAGQPQASRSAMLVDMDVDAHPRQRPPVADRIAGIVRRSEPKDSPDDRPPPTAGNFRQSELDRFGALAAALVGSAGPAESRCTR